MRVRRHRRLAAALGLIGPRRDDVPDRLLEQRNPPPQVEAQVERDLLVTRAAGVEAAARVADPLDQFALDEAVDVLVGTVDVRRVAAAFLEHLLEPFANGGGVLLREHAGGPERFRPREAARYVVFEQRAIEPERDAEIEGRRIGGGCERAGPEGREGGAGRTRARAL